MDDDLRPEYDLSTLTRVPDERERIVGKWLKRFDFLQEIPEYFRKAISYTLEFQEQAIDEDPSIIGHLSRTDVYEIICRTLSDFHLLKFVSFQPTNSKNPVNYYIKRERRPVPSDQEIIEGFQLYDYATIVSEPCSMVSEEWGVEPLTEKMKLDSDWRSKLAIQLQNKLSSQILNDILQGAQFQEVYQLSGETLKDKWHQFRLYVFELRNRINTFDVMMVMGKNMAELAVAASGRDFDFSRPWSYEEYHYDPSFPPNEVLVGNRSLNSLDFGYFYSPSTFLMESPKTEDGKTQLSTCHSKKLLCPEKYARITIEM